MKYVTIKLLTSENVETWICILEFEAILVFETCNLRQGPAL